METSVSRTLVESRRLVSQGHVNPFGTLYGGFMLEWVVDAGTMAAPEDSLDGVLMYGGRLLFRLDELTFIEAFQFFLLSTLLPALIGLCLGDLSTWVIVSVRAGVTYVGSTSVEVGFVVEAFWT